MNIDQVNEFFGDMDLFLIDWVLKGRVPKNGHLLDAGSGMGRNLTYFLNTCWSVTAIDKKSSEIDLLNYTTEQLGRGKVGQVGDVHDLPFENSYFDFIICIRVLHFAENQESFFRMLEELHRVLSQDGQLFVSMASCLSNSFATTPLSDGKLTFPNGKTRFVLNPVLLSEISKTWNHLEDPRTVIFGEQMEETTLIMKPI